MARETYNFPDAARDLLRGIPNYRQLSFLELSCGDGNIINDLRKEGARVRGTTFRSQEEDYIRTQPYPEGLQVDGGIDLNKPLPYPDASFDVVFSTEVIEHVESHRTFISESARVLKPGGYIVMTTPNMHRLMSRFHYFLSGVDLLKVRTIPHSVPIEKMEEFHHHCVEFPILHWLLWQTGLRIEALIPGRVHPVSKLMMVFGPIVRRFTRPALEKYKRPEEEHREGREDLIKWMNSSTLLTSEHICLR
ncbi:MAG TPA: class I SAM-dependent methyltransferase, partial [Tepidisphaeraceae bacterium]